MKQLDLPHTAKAPRNLDDVVAKMLPLIPISEGKLREKLQRIADDAGYIPPEGQYRSWRRASDVLFNAFGGEEPTDGWRRQVLDVFMGRL